MKRMIPSSKLTIKNDKLTAMEGIYDSEGNQIIADGGSLVVGNPEGTATATLSKISIQNDGSPVVYEVPQGTLVEANPSQPTSLLSSITIGNTSYVLDPVYNLQHGMTLTYDSPAESSYAFAFLAMNYKGEEPVSLNVYGSNGNDEDFGGSAYIYFESPVYFEGEVCIAQGDIIKDSSTRVSIDDLKALVTYAKAQGWIS